MSIITEYRDEILYRSNPSQKPRNSYATYLRFKCEHRDDAFVIIDENPDFFVLSVSFCHKKRIFVFEGTEEYDNINGMLAMKDDSPRMLPIVEQVMDSIIASYVNQLFFDNMTLADVVTIVDDAYTTGVRDGKSSLQYQIRGLLGV